MPKLYDMTTDRDGFFVFGGENSKDFGVVIAEAPTFNHAQRKGAAFDVPGRNGAIIRQQKAWNNVPQAYKIWIAAEHDYELPEKAAALAAWLNSLEGYQRLEDSFMPGVYRLAYYNGGQEITNNFMQYGEATISFNCRPEYFQKDGEQPRPLNNGEPIYNPTRFDAAPLLHIEGSGTISVTLGAATITAQVTDYINIDCERMNAYRLPAENMNDKVWGIFPTLKPGVNAVTITGLVNAATITPRFFNI